MLFGKEISFLSVEQSLDTEYYSDVFHLGLLLTKSHCASHLSPAGLRGRVATKPASNPLLRKVDLIFGSIRNVSKPPA